MKNYKITDEALALVAQIPKGKVATYGLIAKKLNTSPRIIGSVLHQNPDPDRYPCHRVVNAGGKVSLFYAFGGQLTQMKKLESEGILFVKGKIDLNKYLAIY